MQRIAVLGTAACLLAAAHASAGQNVATGSLAIPAGAKSDPSPRPAGPPAARAAVINYDTVHLERRLEAVRATGPIALDGALDEPAWREANVANGFIQNDPQEGNPATYDTDVRVLYSEDALYIGVFAHDGDV